MAATASPYTSSSTHTDRYAPGWFTTGSWSLSDHMPCWCWSTSAPPRSGVVPSEAQSRCRLCCRARAKVTSIMVVRASMPKLLIGTCACLAHARRSSNHAGKIRKRCTILSATNMDHPMAVG